MSDYKALYEKQLEENKKLKEERKWADGLTARQVREMFLSKEDILKELDYARKTNLENFAGMWEEAKKNEKLKEENKKLKEENKKLKSEDDTLEDTLASLNFYTEQCAELKDTITSLKSSVVDLRAAREMREYKIEQLQHDAELTKEFWSCLMDCRDNPDDPSKDEIDDWCDSYDKSDEIRYHIYSECGIEDESSEEESSEEEEL